MLAILWIKMQWTKENRTPDGAVQRREYYKPVRIEEDVSLSGEGIFVKKCEYWQQGTEVLSSIEASKRLEQEFQKEKGAFTGTMVREQKMAWHRNQQVRKEKGAFYCIDKVEIPCIDLTEEGKDCFRVRWFDEKLGNPKRRGGNEDLYRKGARLAGRSNTLNETAFLLKKGEAGVLKYNYRLTYYQGQWYECYYVYIVNAEVLTRDIFLREYPYQYCQLADLF